VRRAGSLPSWEGNGMKQTSWDVVVVGSGPGGSVAAKVCSKAGLETILLEKKRLPRDKVCSGMLLGYWARKLVQQEFGDIPTDVLVEPYKGMGFHAGREHSIEMQVPIPVGWRKDIDYWMSSKASEAGAFLRDTARVTALRPHASGYEVDVKGENKETEHLYGRFVIGADGAYSTIRKCFWPDFRVRYRPVARECYKADLSIEKDYFHWFYPAGTATPRYDINYKGGFFLIEGNLRPIRDTVRETLQNYGLPSGAKPLWRDACVNPHVWDALIDGSFVPAKDNVLLVGDTAGMLFPTTHEGIGSALKSGIMAAESVIEALRGNGKAEGPYLKKIEEIKTVLAELQIMTKKLGDAAKEGPDALLGSMVELFDRTIRE
jgi:flavin-dependent dehydrogenase